MASTSTYAIWQNTCTAANHHQFSKHKAESLETLNIRNSDELLALLIRTTTRALPLCSSTEVCPKRLCNQSSPHLPCTHASEHGGETRNRRCMLRLSPDKLSIQASCTGPAECVKRLNPPPDSLVESGPRRVRRPAISYKMPFYICLKFLAFYQPP